MRLKLASGNRLGCSRFSGISSPIFLRPPSTTPGGLDFGDVDLAHFHHCGKGAFGFRAAGRHRVRQHARRDLPGDSPAVFAPAAVAFLAAVADDGFPVAIRFRLSVRRDLEGEGLGLFELRPAIDRHAGYVADGELHGENLALLATGKIARGFADRGDFTVWKGLRVKACCLFRIFVEPKTDGIFGFLFAHKISSSRTIAQILFVTTRVGSHIYTRLTS